MSRVPQISDAEWEVMKVLWERGPLLAAQVVSALAGQKDWSPRTVKTLLTRLVKKGALEYEVTGRQYVYRARATRDACARKETRSFLSRVFDGAVAPALVQFLEVADLSSNEIQQLRDVLEAAPDRPAPQAHQRKKLRRKERP
ncbi:MAG TPA: BlaI/MecI/CopY family transcriptional regulator [Tepidisphaeraceae bacterium]|nr:BlaI/MecI/CopY family transcriptional regulator [Tepidisphaeraceae bacterium]